MSRDLEVRHCRILVAIDDHGGIAAAARALGLAQSTVSETLLSLERIVGTPILLRRPGREAALSPAAQALLPHGRALILASETALAAVSAKSRGIVRLGVVESISSFLLPAPLAAFRRHWPRVEVRIAIGLCGDLRKRVDRFELDAALTVEGADMAAEREGTRKLGAAALRLVVSPDNPLALTPVARADLGPRTFLLADPDGAFNALLRAWFADRGLSPRFESAGSVDGVKHGVLDGETIGVLPSYAVDDALASGSLAALKPAEPLPPIGLLLTVAEPLRDSSPLSELTAQIGEAFNRPAAA
ncbi:MAG TPA: LysR substrate-binding domain-containing protein [Allosphingosinicella sp.]|jgi:molybdate transport repressor ModE-like protein|nr:LysR substrate-binding domain-containing protein [Allosphingosinicella sp.]